MLVLKTLAANFLSGLIKDKLTSSAGIAAVTAAAALPALEPTGQPLTISGDPTVLTVQIISGVIGLVLMYIDRKREK